MTGFLRARAGEYADPRHRIAERRSTRPGGVLGRKLEIYVGGLRQAPHGGDQAHNAC